MSELWQSKSSQRVWALPLVVRLGVLLAVLVAALLPFVLTGTVAHWVALAFVALIVVVAVIVTVAEIIDVGVAARRGTLGVGHPALTGVAISAALLIFVLVLASRDEGDDRAGEQDLGVQQQVQEMNARVQECQRTLPLKTCVQRELRIPRTARSTPADQAAGLRK